MTIAQAKTATGTPVDILADLDGTLHITGTTTIDESTLATSAKQDTGNTSLTAIAASAVLLQQPTRYAAVTPNDSTDVTATATKGLLVTVSGVVNVTGVGDSGAVGLGTWPAGSYIPGALKRVNAATTATVVSCYGP